MSPACSEEPSPGEPGLWPWRVHWGRGGRGGWGESSVANSLCEEILIAGEFPARVPALPSPHPLPWAPSRVVLLFTS